jgi:hypothetical protein
MRRHHEEIAAVPSIVPALSLLIPFAGALWVRIKTAKKNHPKPPDLPTRGGDL